VSDDPTAPYTASNNGTPTINAQQLAEQYGWAYSFLTSVPELNQLFQEAVANQWDSTQFTAQLKTTNWYKTNSASVRAATAAKATDPVTFSANLAQETANIQQTAASLGADISTGLAKTIASQQVTYGWDAAQVQKALAQYVKLNASGAFGGTAGQNSMALNQLAANNGITINPTTMQNIVQNIADNKMTVEDAQNLIREQAASKYPAYAKQILNGVTLASMAAQYQHTMQNVLEVGPDSTSLTSPTIQAALQNMNAQGIPEPLSLPQFEQQLKAQPQWKQTNNAQSSLMAVGNQVLQSMGLLTGASVGGGSPVGSASGAISSSQAVVGSA